MTAALDATAAGTRSDQAGSWFPARTATGPARREGGHPVNVWILTREFDNPAGGGDSYIVSVHSSEDGAKTALAAEPNPEPWYGALTITEWPVDTDGCDRECRAVGCRY